MEKPLLSSIKPDRKIKSDHNVFEECFHNNNNNNNIIITSNVYHALPTSNEIYKNYIQAAYIDNVLTSDECKKLCNTIDNNNDLSFWSASGRDDDEAKAFRNADTIEVQSDIIATIIWNRIKEKFPFIDINIKNDEFDENGIIDTRWERELPGIWKAVNLNSDFLFAKYPSGGSFAPHTDGRTIHNFNYRSFYSVIIFLNSIDDGFGGGTKFYKKEAVESLERSEKNKQWTANQNLMTAEVLPKEGRMLIFDQDLVHEGVPPLEFNQKYIIRSDIMYQRSPAVCNSDIDIEAYKCFRIAEDLAEQGNIEESLPLFRKAFKLSKTLSQMMGQS
jgi:leukotriene-A4 hydrolase